MRQNLPYLFVGFAGLMRIVPHPSNFTPGNSSITYGSACIKDPKFMLFPILVMFISDIILSLIYDYPVVGYWTLYTYPVYLLNCFISRILIKDVRQYSRVCTAVLINSILFFILTNLGYFLVTYPFTFDYLVKTYKDALPFFGFELQANIMYSLIFFGYHSLIYEEKRDENLISVCTN